MSSETQEGVIRIPRGFCQELRDNHSLTFLGSPFSPRGQQKRRSAPAREGGVEEEDRLSFKTIR